MVVPADTIYSLCSVGSLTDQGVGGVDNKVEKTALNQGGYCNNSKQAGVTCITITDYGRKYDKNMSVSGGINC